MPLQSEMKLPQTKNAAEFEDIVCDVCTKKYKREFQKNGRPGQKQYGVDILCDGEDRICIQCKNYILKKKDLEEIINEIKEFDISFSKFIIATSSSRDATLQSVIQKINDEKKLKFIVDIMFWEEIEGIVIKNKKLFKKYYPRLAEIKKSRIKPIKKIVLDFNKCISKYYVVDFVQEDVSIGLPIKSIQYEDLFIEEVKGILKEHHFLQRKKKFYLISQFVETLEEYNVFLSGRLYPTDMNNKLVPCNQLKRDEVKYDKFKKEIDNYKQKLDSLYSKINGGKSLFSV